MSKGALIFAHNNSDVDYVKLANFAAKRIKRFLNIPVTLVTDSVDWLNTSIPEHEFEQVIELFADKPNFKLFYDGSVTSKKLTWHNVTRYQAYDLSPYDRTLVIDSDYILNSSMLKIAMDNDEVFQIYKNSFDLAGWRDTSSFERINPYSIPFYWATAFVFQKDPMTRTFFDLVSYVRENWTYFKMLYNINVPNFRNDFAFSIAIHIMNGKTNGEFAIELPGKMTYIQDRDIILGIKNTSLNFLVEKKDYLGEYIAAKTTGIDVHVMNKLSLSRVIDEVEHV